MPLTRPSGACASTERCPKPNPTRETEAHPGGGCIRQEVWKSRWEIRRKARLPFTKPCLRRKPECRITSAVWLSRGLHLKLHLDDLDGFVAKPVGKFLRGAGIGDQAPDSVKGPYPRNA